MTFSRRDTQQNDTKSGIQQRDIQKIVNKQYDFSQNDDIQQYDIQKNSIKQYDTQQNDIYKNYMQQNDFYQNDIQQNDDSVVRHSKDQHEAELHSAE